MRLPSCGKLKSIVWRIISSDSDVQPTSAWGGDSVDRIHHSVD